MESRNKYSVSTIAVENLLAFINAKEIAIPEIQRPFVWSPKQVRDFIDSLYNGYPTGYLITWQNPSVRLKDGSVSENRKLLIDGQQRVISLMAAIGGEPIITDKYEKKHIKIAFKPIPDESEERFAVQTAAHLKDSKWIPDISELFKPTFKSFNFIHEYCKKNPSYDPEEISDAISDLKDLKNRQLGEIKLTSNLDISQVSDIFVRINSRGKRLNEADFAMSRMASDETHKGHVLRKAIDYFCHAAQEPKFLEDIRQADEEFKRSEFSPQMDWLKAKKGGIYLPLYNDVLRVSFMHQFTRGRLGDLVSLLYGRDFDKRIYTEEVAEDSFSKMRSGLGNFMKESNFSKFSEIIVTAGFTSRKLLRSTITLDFAYTLYLILKESNELTAKTEIFKYVQKWFAISTLKKRYTSSPESQMDKDLREIKENGIKALLASTEAGLGDSFWEVEVVQGLETDSVITPYYSTYLAAQIYFGDRILLSRSATLGSVIDTAEAHHIFPKKYLQENGYDDKYKYNQVANYAFLESTTNVIIGKKAPSEYFKMALDQCKGSEEKIGTILDETELRQNLVANCIPWEIMEMTVKDYPEFLAMRRKLMAEKIKSWYFHL